MTVPDPIDDRADDPAPKRPRWWSAGDDDLVAGFDRHGRPAALRPFFATTITASLLAWGITFALGAYHTVFYSTLFHIVVAATVLLLGSIAFRRLVRVRPWTRGLLSIPLLWLLVRLFEPFGRASRTGRILEGILVGLTVASVPFILWALARIMAPDYFALPDKRLKTASIFIVTLIAVAGFLVGQFNYRFTDCHDYVIAGDDTPADCKASPTTSPTQSPTSSPAPTATAAPHAS